MYFKWSVLCVPVFGAALSHEIRSFCGFFRTVSRANTANMYAPPLVSLYWHIAVIGVSGLGEAQTQITDYHACLVLRSTTDIGINNGK
jgi:hypothetical protein